MACHTRRRRGGGTTGLQICRDHLRARGCQGRADGGANAAGAAGHEGHQAFKAVGGTIGNDRHIVVAALGRWFG
jgi:hypothetical protein